MSQQVNVYRQLELKTGATGSVARILAGDSSTDVSYTAGTPAIAMYFTSSNTSTTNAEPLYIKSTMTGTNGYGGRCRFHCYKNVTGGTNNMAVKAMMEFGSSGRTAGLATALCAELVMPNANMGSGGAYYVLELEYVSGGTSLVTAGSPTGNQAGFIYMNQSGDDDGDFDDNGYLFYLDGVTAGDGHLWDNSVSNATGDNGIRINVNGANKWILVADDNT